MFRKVKALVLFSGGLDSILATLVLREQGIEVKGVCFKSCFFGCRQAQIEARKIGLKLHIIDISEEHLNLTKNPPSGYGKHLNPCIDCHALMIKKAGELARVSGYDFVATGEVLGQRPFSQNKAALERVKKISGVDVLRPLSAKLLGETEAEKNGLVNREKLLDIFGRSRQRQQELIKKYNIQEYPSSAGGCLLTDPSFSRRLGDMLRFWPNCTQDDIELLKHGRVFWLKAKNNCLFSCLKSFFKKLSFLKRSLASLMSSPMVLVIVGRDKEDNDNLERILKKGDFMLQLKEMTGPSTLLRFPKESFNNIFWKDKIIEVFVPKELDIDINSPKDIEQIFYTVATLTAFYTPKARGKKVKIAIDNIS